MTAKQMTVMEKMARTLIHQIGDHRQCPHCRKMFVPDDETTRDAAELYVMLFGTLE